ncbi:MAG: hypothetical protein ACXWQ5_00105 [Ktedonobacterales bacterium]
MNFSFDAHSERDWIAYMQELQRQQAENATAPLFSFTLTPHPFNLAGTRIYLMTGQPMNTFDPQQEEQILANIKKIIEYMYGMTGLPEHLAPRDEANTADEPTPSPEEAGLDIHRLEFIKHLVQKGVFSDF